MRIRSRFLTKLAARAAVALCRLLFATCRKKVVLETPGISPYMDTGDRRFLYCVWHDQIVMTVFTGRPKNMAGLVSRHQDGAYLADAMALLGIEPVRGSTSRGGVRALRQLIETTSNRHVAITPDGPRGPRREARSGIVFLASQTGRCIVPTAHACRRSWTIQGSWTDMMLPRPFTRILALGGRPLEVPPNLTRDGLEHYTSLLESEMARLEAKVERLIAGEDDPPVEIGAAA